MTANRLSRFLAAAVGGLALLLAAVLPAPAGAATPAGCRLVSVPVTVAAHQVTLRGTLCRPSGAAVDTVQLLVSGVTFDQTYWFTPGDPSGRPYARHMTDAGYAVLALDRPGSGLSDRPPAPDVTLDTEVEAIHQVLGRLRDGTLGGHAYRRVIGVGHSFGAGALVAEAARHGDLDAVVATGFVHSVGPRLDELNQAIVPAADDPVLRLTRPPAGYLTTKAGTRAGLFLDASGSSPLMRSAIELTKTTMTTGEQSTLADAGDPAISGAVRVPVFLAVGEHDDLFCNGPYLQCTDAAAVKTWESWFYAPETGPETYVLSGAGHALNLHRNAPELYAAIIRWLGGLAG
ncbi:alpha/beta hydrolase [Microtetraspora fusca]|uniref:alpha/beta hydrolase n=1 Tax=Microtetraspora fusca TaxID=1997 RepID=UPI0008330618|nr:alpha/beta fold hydrolase [Microtetraspora fusca]